MKSYRLYLSTGQTMTVKMTYEEAKEIVELLDETKVYAFDDRDGCLYAARNIVGIQEVDGTGA